MVWRCLFVDFPWRALGVPSVLLTIRHLKTWFQPSPTFPGQVWNHKGHKGLILSRFFVPLWCSAVRCVTLEPENREDVSLLALTQALNGPQRACCKMLYGFCMASAPCTYLYLKALSFAVHLNQFDVQDHIYITPYNAFGREGLLCSMHFLLPSQWCCRPFVSWDRTGGFFCPSMWMAMPLGLSAVPFWRTWRAAHLAPSEYNSMAEIFECTRTLHSAEPWDGVFEKPRFVQHWLVISCLLAPGLVDQLCALLCADADQLQGQGACRKMEPQWQVASGEPWAKDHALEDYARISG